MKNQKILPLTFIKLFLLLTVNRYKTKNDLKENTNRNRNKKSIFVPDDANLKTDVLLDCPHSKIACGRYTPCPHAILRGKRIFPRAPFSLNLISCIRLIIGKLYIYIILTMLLYKLTRLIKSIIEIIFIFAQLKIVSQNSILDLE